MTAYVIVDINVVDTVRYDAYKQMAAPTIAAYGGRYLVRGGRVQTLEGEWVPKRLVIVEFESADRAREWLESPEYREARKLRHETAHSQMILVDGV